MLVHSAYGADQNASSALNPSGKKTLQQKYRLPVLMSLSETSICEPFTPTSNHPFAEKFWFSPNCFLKMAVRADLTCAGLIFLGNIFSKAACESK